MNRYYSIHYYLNGKYYCESGTFHKSEIEIELGKLGNSARLMESNEAHDIWRVDI